MALQMSEEQHSRVDKLGTNERDAPVKAVTVKRLSDEGYGRAQYRGKANFLMPDGDHFMAPCVARFTRERWQGIIDLRGLDRSLEQGDVCRLSTEAMGDLRIIILDRVGTSR